MSTTPLGTPIPSIDELRANSERHLQQSLVDAQQTALPKNDLGPADLELARSNTKALSVVLGIGLHGVYRYLRDFIARQAIPIKASGDFLIGWLATYGMTFKAAASASGTVTGTGVAASVLTTGTLLQTVDGRQYSVQADAVVAAGGAVSATVTALVAGAAGNLSAGAALALVSPVAGIDAAFLAGAGGVTSGADAESEAQAIYRLQQRLSTEPMGGCPADYARWALACPGITRAWGVRNPAGATSAGVVIMADGNTPYGLPTDGQRQAVVDYIRDPQRGPPDELFVIVPTPVVINVTLNVSPDTAAIRAGVIAALQDLFFREAVPGGSMPHSHLQEAVSSVVGEYNHAVSVPTLSQGGVFTTGTYGLLVLGAVTFV